MKLPQRAHSSSISSLLTNLSNAKNTSRAGSRAAHSSKSQPRVHVQPWLHAWLGRSQILALAWEHLHGPASLPMASRVVSIHSASIKSAFHKWSVQAAELDALRARVESDNTTAAATDVAEREAALEAALLDARSSLQSMRSRQEATQSQLLSMQVRCQAWHLVVVRLTVRETLDSGMAKMSCGGLMHLPGCAVSVMCQANRPFCTSCQCV